MSKYIVIDSQNIEEVYASKASKEEAIDCAKGQAAEWNRSFRVYQLIGESKAVTFANFQEVDND